MSYQQQRGGRGDFRGGRGGPGGPGRGSGGRGSPSGGRGSPGGDGRGRGGPPRGGYGGGGQRGGFGGGGRGRGGAPEAPFIYLEGQPAVQAPRLAPDVAKKHIETLSKLPKQFERPFRPGYGTLGTPIVLRSNFFAVKLPKGPLFDYSVEIHPKVAAAGVKTRIFQLLEESAQCAPFRNYMAHNKSDRLITAKKLPQPLDISLEFHEEGEPRGRAGAKVYTVSVVFTRDLNMSEINNYLEGQKDYRGYDPLPIISALNLVLQSHASKAGVRAGNSKYFFGPPVDRLGVGTEVWKGFFLSARPAHKQLLVNVGACFTPFVSHGPMENALSAFQSRTGGALPTLPPNITKSIKVVTQHLGYKRRYKVHSIMSTSARNTFFPCDEFNSKKMSVEEYFKRKYNIALKLADKLPVINVGKRDRPVYIPAELCVIEPGNAYRGRLTDTETSNMINVAKNQPRVTAETIVNQGFPQLGLSPPAGPIQNFGLEIEPEMVVIPGRILPPPGLSYKTGRANLRDGSWNILDVTFQKSGRVDSWWVLIVQDGGREYNQEQQTAVQELTREFAAKLRKNGIAMEDFQKKPPSRLVVTLPPPWNDPGRKQALKMIRDKFEEKSKTGPRPSFVLVILNNRDNYIYPGIKRIGDVELGIQTIHMQFAKASVGGNKADQYFSNVALKVNTKLGGMNHTLDNNAMSWLNKKPTMLVGIDVTHPGPGSVDGTPSIAAVVASTDKDFVQYPGSLRIQHSKKEMLDELSDMMIERIQLFQKRNKNVPPARIIVFRDGVSEGQFDTVVKEELPQIKKAVTKINIQGYNPQISIIICGKRHHAKFFPTNSQHADKNGNTKAGTVVDKGVTAVFDFDFYLQAHAGLQGTVRPTHYTVVYDESSLTADDIQKGTNDASYLYARATKAVSLVPPAYYADLACERGRCYLNDFLVSDDGASSAAGSSAKKEEAEKVYNAAKKAWGQGLHPNMRETMFYI